MDNLSIYITSISEGKDYLLGEWVKLPVPPEKLDEVLARIGNEYEEYLVTDYEAAFANLNISQYSSIADIVDIIDQLDDFDLLVGVEDDQGLGEYFADELCTLEAVPTHLRGYFDYEAYGRDIRLESSNCCFTSYGFVVDNR